MSTPAPITDLDGAIDNIVTHATIVAATLTVPITDVARADPVPRGNCIRVFWSQEVAPPGFTDGPRVLNGEMVGQQVGFAAFWRVGDAGEALASHRDKDVQKFADGFRSRIQGDSTLGGKCIDLDMQYSQSDFVNLSGITWRLLVGQIDLSYISYSRTN